MKTITYEVVEGKNVPGKWKLSKAYGLRESPIDVYYISRNGSAAIDLKTLLPQAILAV